MTKPRYDKAQLKDLLLQMMETELGGEQVYRTALTCAINEVPLEEALGLDHASNGVLAICGFGWRANEMVTMELDPAGEIWHAETPAL